MKIGISIAIFINELLGRWRNMDDLLTCRKEPKNMKELGNDFINLPERISQIWAY